MAASRYKRPCLVFALLLSAEMAGAGPPASPDDWPRYGHDGRLTSRSSLGGRITRPHVAWSYSLAGRELLIEFTPPGAGPESSATRSVAAAPQVPRSQSRQLDLDGSGTRRPATETYHERWARILPAVKGWQRVAWNQVWTDQKVCRLQLFAYDEGFDRPRMVWETDPPEATVFQPLDIVYDIDGDGVQEICVAAHYRVMIFEGTTGRKETELRYHDSRPYGWFGLADVDADGQVELVTLGDFQSHIDVLKYDPQRPESERLSVLWRRDIERNIDERKKWPQLGPRPVVDVTGDGRPEIVLSLFNDTGDNEWHAVALDAATGRSVYDATRRFVQGTADVDGDGGAELFLTQTDGVWVPAFSDIDLVKLRDGAATTLWSQANAAWAVADLPAMEPTWSTSASQGMRHVMVTASQPRHRPCFLVLERGRDAEPPFSTTVSALRAQADGHIDTIWRVEGIVGDLEPVALASLEPEGSAGALFRLRVPAGTAAAPVGTGATSRIVEDQPLGIRVSSPVAGRMHPDGRTTIAVEGAARQIFAIEAPTAAHAAPRLLWRQPGRGMTDGSRWLGPAMADLDGDGGGELIVADEDAAGQAMLVAYRHDGSRLWAVRLDETPGALPVWNMAALTYWWPGRFRDPHRVDVFVNTRRGLMHSDIGQLIDGRTGAVIWRQEKAVVPDQFSWGYAGIPPGVADVTGDGRDELISLYPVCFWVADGATGRLMHGVDLAGRKSLPAWAAYGESMIHPFSGRDEPEVLLDSPYILAVLDTTGIPIWHGLGRADFPTTQSEGNAGETTQVKHALIDLDGDGVFEIASGGYGDGVRAIDPKDGRVLWSLAAPAPTCPRGVAADIDGRPGDELLYPAGSVLVAITGDRGAGRLLWEWQGPASLSMPAIADVDDDGMAEIVVEAADGSIHCLDAPPSELPPNVGAREEP